MLIFLHKTLYLYKPKQSISKEPDKNNNIITANRVIYQEQFAYQAKIEMSYELK
jgi:hypothetical protein